MGLKKLRAVLICNLWAALLELMLFARHSRREVCVRILYLNLDCGCIIRVAVHCSFVILVNAFRHNEASFATTKDCITVVGRGPGSGVCKFVVLRGSGDGIAYPVVLRGLGNGVAYL
jgi:hypothetical protein